MTTDDPVNHPSHYTSHPSGIETYDLIRDLPFGPASAVKYVVRHRLKGNPAQDLKKALWNLQDAQKHGVTFAVSAELHELVRRFIEKEEQGWVTVFMSRLYYSASHDPRGYKAAIGAVETLLALEPSQ